MSEQSPEKQSIITPGQVNEQVDAYIADESIHQQGSLHGTMGRAQNIRGGGVGLYPRKSSADPDETRIIDVKGPVEGQALSARVVTTKFGDLEPNVQEARTSDEKSKYFSAGYGQHAAVVRKTEDGSDYYIHRFKDPAKAKRAGELITSLASKRASRIVTSTGGKNSERSAA